MESPQQPRKQFKTTQDWNDFIVEAQQNKQPLTGQYLLGMRTACYEEIEQHRGRPLLVYATKFLEGVPPGAPNSIDLMDVDGFTDLVNSVKEGRSVDVLLHSPGGRPDATERLVGLLRNRFDEVHFLIPHSAYSAATMLALSGNSITLHPSATLGPIDPQINGIPARSIKRGFEKAKQSIAKEGPETLPAYIPLIEKYSLDLFELCDDSEKLSKKLVSTWLKAYMYGGAPGNGRKIGRAVKYFSDYDKHLMHSRPIPMEKLAEFNLNIALADDKLRELLWESYILLNGFFSVSPFVKLYESAHGVSWGKQFQQVMFGPPPQQRIQPQPTPSR